MALTSHCICSHTTMYEYIALLLIITVSNFAQIQKNNEMEGKVVKGKLTRIQRHPHSVFLFIWGESGGHICGGSIINQRVILTAGHCFEHSTGAIAKVGTTDIKIGSSYPVKSWIIHPKYDTNKITNDIAIAGLAKAIEFGIKVKRIVIANKRRDEGMAKVAGWGVVQEFPQEVFSDYLHEVSVPFMSQEKCIRILKTMHVGTLCGGRLRAKSHPGAGDSGSPLVFKNYIQIGLVSFKMNYLSRSVVVFTDVPYFYKWITQNAQTVFCKTGFNGPPEVSHNLTYEEEYYDDYYEGDTK